LGFQVVEHFGDEFVLAGVGPNRKSVGLFVGENFQFAEFVGQR
jgi:hypothetical protein